MSSRFRSRLSTHAAFAALSVLAASASAQSNERFTYTVNTQYQASGLDAMGDNGKYNSSVLIGPHIAIPGNLGNGVYGGKVSVDIPAIDWGFFTTPPAHLGYLGAEANLVLNGDCGIRVTPNYSGGKLDYTYNSLLTLDMPRYPVPGQSVTIKYSTGASFSTLHTTAPTFSASLDAVASFTGSIGGSAYFFSDTPFASGTHTFNASAPTKNLGTYDFTGGGAQALVQTINDAVGKANPLPISINGYIPVLTAGPASVDSTGTVNARGFAKFLSLDTSLLDLMLTVIGGNVGKTLEITQGDYSIPGTNYDVNWAICKTAANMDVGLDGQYTLKPINKKVTLAIVDASGKTVVPTGQTDNSVTFTMPAGGVSITPTLDQDFQFTNTVGVNIQGAIGFYPFSGGAKGNLSDALAGSTSVDFQFDVTRLEKKFDSTDGTSSQIYTNTFTLPQQADHAHTLAKIGLSAYSPTDLPNELFFPESYSSTNQNPRIANLHAYGEGGDQGYVLLSIFPEQGRQFFLPPGSVNGDGSASNGSGKIPLKASMLFPDGVRLLVTRTANGQPGGLVVDSVSGSKIVLRVPLNYANFAFARGIYSMSLTIDTVNAVGGNVTKTYNFPLQAYARNPQISGQFNTQPDLDVQGSTFRVTPLAIDPTDPKGQRPATEATTQNLYFNSQFVLKDTVMTIDNPNDPANPYVLPVYSVGNDGGLAPLQDSGVKGNEVCAISLSNALVQELGGVIHTMQLRTPETGSKPDGTPYNPALSTPTSLFFIAAKPNITSTMVDTGAGYGDTPFWIGLTGSSFAQATQAYITGASGTIQVPVAYGSPTSMRVQVPAAFIQNAHNAGRSGYTLKLTTPPFTTPSNDTAGVYPSGGDSNPVNFNLAYPAPSVASLSQTKIPRGTTSLTMRVTGSNLFQYSAGNQATVFTVNGQPVAPSSVVYPASTGITVPYVDIPIDPAILAKNGTYAVVASNNGVSSVGTTFTVENGAPNLGSLSRTRFRVGPNFAYTPDLYGAPFYQETKFSLNGSGVPVAKLTPSDATLNLNYSFLGGIKANVIDLIAYNPKPGGGTSNPISVTLEEGDPNTVKVVPGGLVYDRLSDTYKQSIAVTYLGSRDVSRGVAIAFNGVGSGVTLVNQSGVGSGNVPYIVTSLAPRRQVTFVAVWKKSGGATISSSPVPNFSLID